MEQVNLSRRTLMTLAAPATALSLAACTSIPEAKDVSPETLAAAGAAATRYQASFFLGSPGARPIMQVFWSALCGDSMKLYADVLRPRLRSGSIGRSYSVLMHYLPRTESDLDAYVALRSHSGTRFARECQRVLEAGAAKRSYLLAEEVVGLVGAGSGSAYNAELARDTAVLMNKVARGDLGIRQTPALLTPEGKVSYAIAERLA